MLELSEQTFLMYAAKYYDNPQCMDIEEFYDDLKRFAYIKRLFGKFKDTGELKERLILNHLTVLFNIFGVNAVELLFFKLDEDHYRYLKPFLILLNYMPESIKLNSEVLKSSDIPMDHQIVARLRNI